MSNFVDCDRDQAFLLPPDLRDWIPADDLAHFVIEAVERVDLGAFKVSHRGTGSAQYLWWSWFVGQVGSKVKVSSGF